MGEQVSEFDEGSAVAPRVDEPGAYDVALGDGWRIGGGVNGGILLATIGRALAVELGAADDERPAHPHPLAISAYFLTPGAPGPATRADLGAASRSLGVQRAGLPAPGRRLRC